MIEEIWKSIKGYEDRYQISSFGNVKSLNYGRSKKEKILKPTVDGSKYFMVTLFNESGKKTSKIHKLVAIHFLNHIPCGHKLVVNHKDFNRLNNHIDNLELITQRENSNQKHLKSSSKYTGVCLIKKKNKWRSSIKINGRLKCLGVYEKEIDAHYAYENKLKEIINEKR